MNAVPHYPRRYSISAEEYLRIAEAGIFAAETRLELVEGEILEMAPIGSRHAAVVNRLNGFLVRSVGDRAIVSVQNPAIISPRSVPQPDLLLLTPRADGYFDALPMAREVLLVIEVADSSLRFDLERKVPLYGRAGIPQAWVIDVENRQLHVFTLPDTSAGYRCSSIASPSEKVGIAALPTVDITVADLFPS
jgi:Uma2 family endonuclease